MLFIKNLKKKIWKKENFLIASDLKFSVHKNQNSKRVFKVFEIKGLQIKLQIQFIFNVDKNYFKNRKKLQFCKLFFKPFYFGEEDIFFLSDYKK